MLLSDLFEEFGNDTSLEEKNQLVKISELCKQKLAETSDSTRNLVSWIENKQKKRYGPFLWMGFNWLKATEPLQGDSLLFTTKSPEIPGTHLINLRRMKGWIGYAATQWFWTKNPWIWNPEP